MPAFSTSVDLCSREGKNTDGVGGSEENFALVKKKKKNNF